MIKIAGDTHTHTILCGHAVSTVMENLTQAKKLGHTFLCVTEHTPAIVGGANWVFFDYLDYNMPRSAEGILLVRGAELNIMDYSGTVDLPVEVIKKLEWVLASYHHLVIEQGSVADHTRGWVHIAENPLIHAIGHCDRRYKFEMAPVFKAFKDAGKIVELNANMLENNEPAINACRDIAVWCAELGIRVVLSSDAHMCVLVGEVAPVVKILEEIGFPQELILNTDHNKFLEVLRGELGPLANQ